MPEAHWVGIANGLAAACRVSHSRACHARRFQLYAVDVGRNGDARGPHRRPYGRCDFLELCHAAVFFGFQCACGRCRERHTFDAGLTLGTRRPVYEQREMRAHHASGSPDHEHRDGVENFLSGDFETFGKQILQR
jgi:hypothetical protein